MGKADLSELARTLFAKALADCSIERAMALKVRFEKGKSDAGTLTLGQDTVDLAHFKHLRIVAIGKAAPAMLDALLQRLKLSSHFDAAGILITPVRPAKLPRGFEFFAGGHPLPNEASFAGARAVLEFLRKIPAAASKTQDTLCLFLISGGASAMMELPLDPTITLEDTVLFHRALVHSGANITEMNSVRKHFSAVKGGRLAEAAKEAACFSILVSDVPAGNPDTIASGPTLPDKSTTDDCREILDRYNLLDRFPASVRRFFASPELPETPKPASLAARSFTLLDSDDLAQAAHQQAEQLGFHAVIDNSCDDWDYRAASEYLLARLRGLRREHERICLISVGEVAVSLPTCGNGAGSDLAKSCVGGRNQHLALYTATLLEPADHPIAVLSAGSDGIDGNSVAAGAVVNEETLHIENLAWTHAENTINNRRLHTEALEALQQFRSFTFLEGLGAILLTGPTGINLRDLRIFLAEPQSHIESGTIAQQVQAKS